MKKNILLLATVAALLTTSTLASNAATQVYDLKADWSDTQNPNGTWSYRTDGELMVNNPFPWVSNPFFPEAGYITKITTANSVPGALEAGDISSGSIGNSVGVRWTSASSGVITISAIMWNAGDFYSTREWTLIHNGNVISSDPLGPYNAPRSSPLELSWPNIPVNAGDQIELIFHAGELIGFNLTITLTPDSVDPVSAIEDLAIAVFEMNLQNGIENSLDSKLDAAVNALIDANFNNDGAACNSLGAFISAVEAQRGKKITSAQADQLIASAQEIRALLSCGN